MPLSVAIAAALDLTVDDSETQVIAAITALKATAQAANSEKANIAHYMPRADYDAVLLRATNAEGALATSKKAEHAKAVDAEINAALKAGKITPATTDYHRAACQEDGGLERFRSFVGAAPVVGDPSGLDGRKATPTATALNAEQQAMCVQFGIDQADYLKTLQSEG